MPNTHVPASASGLPIPSLHELSGHPDAKLIAIGQKMAALYPQFVEVDRARLATWTAWDDACTKAGKRRDMWATDQGYSLPEYAAYDQAFELAGLLQVQPNTLGQRALELPPTTLEGLAAYAVAVRHMGIDKGEHAKDYPDLDFQAARIADFTRIVREAVRATTGKEWGLSETPALQTPRRLSAHALRARTHRTSGRSS